MLDPQVAYDKLIQFQTAEELAGFLIHEGIRGDTASPFSCPIAQYMQSTTGQPACVASMIRIYDPEEDPSVNDENYTASFMHTAATLNFMKEFDHGLWPELVVPGHPVIVIK